MTSLRKEIERVMNLKGEKEKILYVHLALIYYVHLEFMKTLILIYYIHL